MYIINLIFSFIKGCIDVNKAYIGSKDQQAVIMTKPLSKELHFL